MLLIPKSIPCPHCNQKINISYIAKYFGKIKNLKDEEEEIKDGNS